MEAFDIVMMCVMIPGIVLTLWAVGRLGSAGYNGIKGKDDREKDERKEVRNYFLKHDDYVLDDRTYLENTGKKASDYTDMNARVKLGLEDRKLTSAAWKSWLIAGNLARRTKSGVVSSKLELCWSYLSEDTLYLYRVQLQTDSSIAEERTYSWAKKDIRAIESEKGEEYGMGENDTDVKSTVRYLSITLPYGDEKIRIPEGKSGDDIVSLFQNWIG